MITSMSKYTSGGSSFITENLKQNAEAKYFYSLNKSFELHAHTNKDTLCN